MRKVTWLAIFMSVILLAGFLNGTHASSTLQGKVTETMDSGGYTYVNLETDGKKTWVAIPKTKVDVGQVIAFQPGMEMTGFESKSLNRTFESITFSAGIAGESAGSEKKPAVSGKTETAQSKPVKVEKATGPDAYTIAELYGKLADLDKKNIIVRGKVVKFSANIMGKNWIHVQDGSGDPAKGTNDIIITSQEILEVGDTATFQGTLYRDKDFGSGYKYAAIVEEASVKK
ncbi:MAG: hypothetical protein JSV11_09030 [Nitrospiraceae bacterium]|nr:MAG: hypothetical protein JSV11_09030 [Nitrospiraceae bacterium]